MSRRRIPWGSLCKLLGVAGLAGVAATGVVAARDERRRRAYTPDEVRARLQERVAVAQENAAQDGTAEDGPAEDGTAQDGTAQDGTAPDEAGPGRPHVHGRG
ncbi:MAG: hypothetical protein JNM77_17440 [Pseudonocardia sp.]|nr:hypothetical protein [Pseudonocardia sp.]